MSITAKNIYKTHQLNSDGWVVGGENGGSGITQSVLSGSYAEDQKYRHHRVVYLINI